MPLGQKPLMLFLLSFLLFDGCAMHLSFLPAQSHLVSRKLVYPLYLGAFKGSVARGFRTELPVERVPRCRGSQDSVKPTLSPHRTHSHSGVRLDYKTTSGHQSSVITAALSVSHYGGSVFLVGLELR